MKVSTHTSKNNPLWNSVNEYILYLQFERRLSNNTLKAYKNDLKKYTDYLAYTFGLTKIQLIKPHHIEKFANSINSSIQINISRQIKKTSSLHRLYSTIRCFHQYLYQVSVASTDPSELLTSPRLSKNIPVTLMVEEINQIIDAVDMKKKYAQRDKALLSTLYACGLRVSEIIKLKVQNVINGEGLIRISGKGNKERIVPIGQIALMYINVYVKELRIHMLSQKHSHGILFLNNKGNKLTRMSVWNIVNANTVRAGINKKVSPHVFRHSFATHLLEGGANLRSVQEMLGHADITTTQVYTKTDKIYLKEIHKQYHPRG